MKKIISVALSSLVLTSLSSSLPITSVARAEETQIQSQIQTQVPQTNRKRIAVLDFDFNATAVTSEAWYYGLFHNGSPARGVSDLIANKLAQSGAYSVIERSKINEILQEQDLGQSGRIDPSTAAQIGKILGVDAVLIGSITRFNLEERSSGGVLGFVGIGGRQSRQKATVEIASRLVSTTTAEILAASEGSGSSSSTGGSLTIFGLGSGGSDADKSDTLLSNAADKAVTNLIPEINAAAPKLAAMPSVAPTVNAIVADVTGNVVTINKGNRDGFKPGMILSVEQVIKEIKDPETGAVIRKQTASVGKIKLTEVDSTSAVGTIMTASGKIKIGDVTKAVNGTE